MHWIAGNFHKVQFSQIHCSQNEGEPLSHIELKYACGKITGFLQTFQKIPSASFLLEQHVCG